MGGCQDYDDPFLGTLNIRWRIENRDHHNFDNHPHDSHTLFVSFCSDGCLRPFTLRRFLEAADAIPTLNPEPESSYPKPSTPYPIHLQAQSASSRTLTGSYLG